MLYNSTELFDFRKEYKTINTILPHNMCGHNQRYEEKYKPKNKMIKSLEGKKVDEGNNLLIKRRKCISYLVAY